jgi:hypothetical protein
LFFFNQFPDVFVQAGVVTKVQSKLDFFAHCLNPFSVCLSIYYSGFDCGEQVRIFALEDRHWRGTPEVFHLTRISTGAARERAYISECLYDKSDKSDKAERN